MNHLTRFGIFCVASMFVSSVSAECTTGQGTILSFANGVGNTDPGKAESMKTVLENRIRPKIEKLVSDGILPEEDAAFVAELAHNPTPIYNLRKLWQQRSFDVSMKPYQDWLDGKGEFPNDAPLTEDELAQKVMENGTNNPVLQDFIEQSKGWYNAGKREIRVCHSQGCFFSNEQYNQMALTLPNWKDSFDLTAVGTPASFVAGDENDFQYVTLKEDKIINAIRLLPGQDPLQGLYRNPESRDWSSNHQFVRDYLNGSFTQEQIKALLVYSFENTPYPETGGLTVTLEWGGDDDLDLVILEEVGDEPNPVYKEEPVGINGTLAISESQNLETYSTTCETASGVYQVGVGKADGDIESATSFKLTISVGDLREVVEWTLQPYEPFRFFEEVYVPESGDPIVLPIEDDIFE